MCSLDGSINALLDDAPWTFLVGIESPCQDLVSFYGVSLGWEEQESSINNDGRVKKRLFDKKMKETRKKDSATNKIKKKRESEVKVNKEDIERRSV